MKRKVKGGTFGGILVTLLIVAIIVIVLIKLGILSFGGFGNGGDGEAVQANADITVSDEVTENETTTTIQEKIPIEVNISGEEYLYNNQSYSLDDLMAEIAQIEGGVEVHINLDDTATLSAREALEARLDEENILYNIAEKTE